MRTPDPPFLELGFHFNRVSGRDSFRKLVKTFFDGFDAVPKEVMLRATGKSVLFRSDEEVAISSERVSSKSDVWRLINDETRLAVKLTIESGTRIIPDAQEYISLLPISSSNPSDCGNSVAIWIEGAAFSIPSSLSGIPAKTRKIGLKVRSVFLDLIKRINPTYAAMTVDYGLESPCDLREDSRTNAFRDFYLQRQHFGASTIQEIKSRFPNADYEDIGAGEIVTTTRSFVRNIDDFEFDSTDAYKLSTYVGKIIAMS